MRICRSSEPVSLFALSLYRQWYFIIHSRVSHMLHLPSGGGELQLFDGERFGIIALKCHWKIFNKEVNFASLMKIRVIESD